MKSPGKRRGDTPKLLIKVTIGEGDFYKKDVTLYIRILSF